jgi:hypothetical protein
MENGIMGFLTNLSSITQSISSTANRIGSFATTVGGFVDSFQNLQNTFQNTSRNARQGNFTSNIQNITNAVTYISQIRLGNLPAGAEYTEQTRAYGSYSAASQTSGSDWRVKISLPNTPEFLNSSMFAPLKYSGNAMVFPTTPQINISHTANYNSLSPTHTNYPFLQYQNSSVDDIGITGEFPVENESDGRYWIAAVHFLRSVTKMFYGSSTNLGAPPPIVYLSGYGDFIFNKVPCVVKLFTMDLRNDVDYIKVPINGGFSSDNNSSSYSYVPVLSNLNITVQPIYSRDDVSQFNLDEFAKGGYIGQQSTTNKGFI